MATWIVGWQPPAGCDSGVIGYFSLSGTADLFIAIRAIVATGGSAPNSV